ncbi:hypothetical protein [Microcoleus sp. B4-D4]|uniref:hypothetical protein n=1 Tax=Microcoleus sp. B4-D4 TaxID=2818667 RepID=UPI002FD5BB5D
MQAKYGIPSCAIASESAIELAWHLLGFNNPTLLQADADAGYTYLHQINLYITLAIDLNTINILSVLNKSIQPSLKVLMK